MHRPHTPFPDRPCSFLLRPESRYPLTLAAAAQGLKLSVLRKRAVAESVDLRAVESAEDTEDPRSAMVELLVLQGVSAAAAAAAVEAAGAAEKERLRLELQGMKLSMLRKRAVAECAAAGALEEAEDSADPRGALVELLIDLAQQSRATEVSKLPLPAPPVVAQENEPGAQPPAKQFSRGAKPHFAAGAAPAPRSLRTCGGPTSTRVH